MNEPLDQSPYPRPLTDVEKAAARRVLELRHVAELGVLLEQLEAAVATYGMAPDPSISIAVDDSTAKPISNRAYMVADAVWEHGSIMVWIDRGWLCYLEIDWHGDTPPLEFPRASDIRASPAG